MIGMGLMVNSLGLIRSDGIVARKAGEEKYFGEWSYDKSQKC